MKILQKVQLDFSCYFASFINYTTMFLLTDLTETGYLQIKKDRELLVEKMNGLQVLIDEIDLALPFLHSIYEPEFKIARDERVGFYLAKTTIPFNKGGKLRIVVKVGTIDRYKMLDDPALIRDAKKKIEEKIKQEFPLHFK